jgi:hypothetical protein
MGTSMVRPRQAMVLSVALALASSLFGQSEQSVKGFVVTKDGQPIAGVLVQGSIWKRCCPYQQDKATTNEKGEFFLEHGGAVVHFSKPDLQPLAFVVKPGTFRVRIVMSPAENQLTVPACVQPDSAHKLVGWGNYGLHFAVPKAGVQILGGKPDVDYVRYVIKPEKNDSYLNLWFGPYSISTEPDDEQFVDSLEFSQRNLATDKGVIGMDSRGRARSGQNWRRTAAFGSGAVYRDVDKESAALFDKIIDSICWTDYPRK